MKNSAALKRQMRYQQWVEVVKDFNARPKDMTVREWCAIHNIKPPTFYDYLRRVQDYYAGQIQSSEASTQMIALATEVGFAYAFESLATVGVHLCILLALFKDDYKR